MEPRKVQAKKKDSEEKPSIFSSSFSAFFNIKLDVYVFVKRGKRN